VGQVTLPALLAALLPLLLVASTWAMFLPQLLRALRVGPAGVSAAGWAAMLSGRLVIVLYGLAVGDPVQLWAAALPTAASTIILVVALRPASRTERLRSTLWAAAVAVLALVTLLAPGAASAALVAMAVFSSVPHLVAAATSADTSGVSVLAWSASAVSSALWVLHGVSSAFPAVVVANTIWLVVSVAVAAVVTLRGRPQL
jgi:uncharacterized protein with PQ loop repeat